MTELKNRFDFVLFFDVQDGNPNGDPDAGNLPRVDPETGHGLVTDVCLKRKVRNYIQLARPEQEGYEIYVKERAVLGQQQARAYAALGLDGGAESDDVAEENGGKRGRASKKARKAEESNDVDRARKWMCDNFFDIRTFGAVMGLKENNCGQVRGPVQLTFARSVDPIVTLEHSITRMAVATMKEADKQGGDNRTMGRKMTIPYGLYRAHGFVSPALARQTGFSTEDADLLWTALVEMFEHDRSAARGLMATRKLVVFRHETELGNAPAHRLFDKVRAIRRNLEVPPRRFADYEIEIEKSLPPGVTLVGPMA